MTRKLKSETSSQKIDVSADIIFWSLILQSDFVILDLNDVKPFQNPTETSPFDHFLDPQSIQRLFKTINRCLIQTLLLLTLFQQFTTGVRLVTCIPK